MRRILSIREIIVKTKLIVLALAVCFAAAANATDGQTADGICVLEGRHNDGDASLIVVSESGLKGFQCRADVVPRLDDVSYRPSPGGAIVEQIRGRTNYSNEDTGGTALVDFKAQPGSFTTLKLVGVVAASHDLQGVHKSSIFGMELAAIPAQRELRVALIENVTSDPSKFQLEVTILNQWNGESSHIGTVPVASRSGFDLSVTKNSSQRGFNLILSSGAASTTFKIASELGVKGIHGWHFGLLNDVTADNAVPYTWLLAPGPKPLITVH